MTKIGINLFFFSSRRRHTRCSRDWSSDVCSSDLIIIDIVVRGDTAYDYGWHEFTLRPKDGGQPIRKRVRYFELWSKDSSGDWKIAFHINNHDVREELGGSVSHWFLRSEEHTSELQ